MLKIKETTGMVIAEDTRATIKAIDTALLQEARLAGSVIEASDQIGLPMVHSQKLLEGMSRGFEKLVAGRADMLTVVRQLTAIKGRSTLEVVDYGCPTGFEAKLAEPATDAPVPVTVG
jgi:hypothetical protein